MRLEAVELPLTSGAREIFSATAVHRHKEPKPQAQAHGMTENDLKVS